MAGAAMQVELVSPEKLLFSGEATLVVARTSDGDAAFLANHAPFIGSLGIGPVLIRTTDGKDHRAAVHGGFVEVRNNKVTILSDVAELAGDIDVARATDAKSRAEQAADADGASALRRATVRLDVASAR